MTKRLFVDVDGTLLCWQKTAECLHTEHEKLGDVRHWRPNERVVEYVKRWAAANPDGPVIVWSGEGQRYAEKWGKVFFPETPHKAHGKGDFRWHTLSTGDLYIDDHPAAYWHGTVIDPFAEEYPEP